MLTYEQIIKDHDCYIKLMQINIKEARNILQHKILLLYKLEGQLCDDIIYTIGKDLIDEFKKECKNLPITKSSKNIILINDSIINRNLQLEFNWLNIDIRKKLYLPSKIIFTHDAQFENGPNRIISREPDNVEVFYDFKPSIKHTLPL